MGLAARGVEAVGVLLVSVVASGLVQAVAVRPTIMDSIVNRPIDRTDLRVDLDREVSFMEISKRVRLERVLISLRSEMTIG